ncbi:MAG: PE-PPE domain-containing protein, partial [Mycobacterium sp.]
VQHHGRDQPVRPYAQDADLSTVPAQNITTTTNGQGGTTTTYLVPTEQLPLTMPLRQLGVPSGWVDSLDDGLRPIIDAGYKPLNCGSPAPQTDVLAAAAPPRSTPSAARRSITAGGADASPATSASARKRGSSSQRAATGTSERHSPAR